MFRTYPNAEQFLPPIFTTLGEKSWKWIEFSLQTPSFLLSFKIDTEAGTMEQHFLFAQMDELLCAVSDTSVVVTDKKISLLSPGYMNGSGSYQLGSIKEIWEHQKNHGHTFVMIDGSRMQFSFGGDKNVDCEMKLILSL